jgi:hypothetical protein
MRCLLGLGPALLSAAAAAAAAAGLAATDLLHDTAAAKRLRHIHALKKVCLQECRQAKQVIHGL